MKRFLDIPPIWTVAMAALSLLLHWAIPFDVLSGPSAQGAGVALASGGIALAVWAMIRFRLNATPVEPRHTPTALVSDGPYRFNRNPMYTGLTMLLLGLAVWLGSPLSLAPAIALPFILTARFIRGEEAALFLTFPDEAADFLARTRRW